jgi:hypothetical protein
MAKKPTAKERGLDAFFDVWSAKAPTKGTFYETELTHVEDLRVKPWQTLRFLRH